MASGVLQRAFPNSTLKLDDFTSTAGDADTADIHHLLRCTELRSITFCLHPRVTISSGKPSPLWARYMAAACSSRQADLLAVLP